MSIATAKQAVHTMAVIEQQNPSREDYEVLHAGFLAALIQAARRGKLDDLAHFRKVIGLGIFELVVPHVRCSASVAFRVGDRFIVDESAEVPISFLNENWKSWFGDMVVGATEACDLEVHKLTEDSLDKPIIEEIGQELCETSPAVLYAMMKNGHLSKDKWYLLYMKDINGVRRAVGVCWRVGGWRVDAYSASCPLGWGAGGRVVSRKRCVTQS